jgi:hypothetical protein
MHAIDGAEDARPVVHTNKNLKRSFFAGRKRDFRNE